MEHGITENQTTTTTGTTGRKTKTFSKTMHILSYGGGVDSTGLLIHLVENKMPLDMVMFADTGDELPETYATVQYYRKYCEDHGIPFVTVFNKYNKALSEYLTEKHIFASRRKRDCTSKFKIAPMRAYLRETFGKDTLFVKYIGYDADEQGRADKAGKASGRLYEKLEYPLIDAGIKRADIIEMCKVRGLPVPEKSGCFHCPFTRKCGWINLKVKHPELFARAKALEENSLEAAKGYFLFSKRPLSSLEAEIAEMDKAEVEVIVSAGRSIGGGF